jgi:tRNA(Arg) A34 adenosine deaminase TadA
MDLGEKFMRKAIALSIENIKKGGGPFAAVIAKDNQIIATGTNHVTAKNDPTAHAEIIAIQKASLKLGTFNLTGCEIYSSCEPCPMCLGAIYWAHLDRLFYGNTKTDAKSIDFDDSFIYDEIALPPENRKLKSTRLLANESILAFEMWSKTADKIKY